MSRREGLVVGPLLGALTLLAGACGGYGDLPIPVRESATLIIEEVDLHPGAIGRLQVRFDTPDGVPTPAGPLVVVGPPAAVADNLDPVVVNWVHGPCDAQETGLSESPLRLCLAVFVPEGGPAPIGMRVGLIVDARGQARRFSVIGDIEVAP